MNGSVHVYDPMSDEDDESEPLSRVLHAKAYAFHAPGGGALVWIGSANMTSTALGRTPANGGNVELLVRARLPADEWAAMKDDLGTWFKPAGPLLADVKREEDGIPSPKSNVLGCELSLARNGPVLLIQAATATGRIVLADRSGKQRITVMIRNGRGKVSGGALARLGLSGAALDVPCALFVFEQVRGAVIPLIVNVPHVPQVEAGLSELLTLDVLLQDLRGRIPVRKVMDDDGDDLDRDDDDDLDVKAPDENDRDLDEVKHQGMLDQLAVRAVLLKRLINQRIGVGQRDAFVEEVRRELINAVPSHLAGVARRFFAV
jgi:hypothetical protein